MGDPLEGRRALRVVQSPCELEAPFQGGCSEGVRRWEPRRDRDRDWDPTSGLRAQAECPGCPLTTSLAAMTTRKTKGDRRARRGPIPAQRPPHPGKSTARRLVGGMQRECGHRRRGRDEGDSGPVTGAPSVCTLISTGAVRTRELEGVPLRLAPVCLGSVAARPPVQRRNAVISGL